MGGGAWPFLVGGVICLVNSDNERDSPLLNSRLDLDSRVPKRVVKVESRLPGVCRVNACVPLGTLCSRLASLVALQVRRLPGCGCVSRVFVVGKTLLRGIDGSEAVRD